MNGLPPDRRPDLIALSRLRERVAEGRVRAHLCAKKPDPHPSFAHLLPQAGEGGPSYQILTRSSGSR
jgi:hypothetical protein